MFHWAPSVNLHTVKNLKNFSIENKSSTLKSHLDPTEAFGGVEGKCNREEIIRVATDTELKAATLVVCIDHWVL